MAITGYEVDQVKPEVNCHPDPGQHVDAQVTHHDGGDGEHEESGSRGLGGFACYPDCSEDDQSVRSWKISTSILVDKLRIRYDFDSQCILTLLGGYRYS